MYHSSSLKRNAFYIHSDSQAGMISNPRLIVGRKVESGGQQIIRAIFIFLTPPSTVNSQQSTVNKHGRCNWNRYHSQDTARCRFPKINRAIVTSLDRRMRLFWARERVRCRVQSFYHSCLTGIDIISSSSLK